MMQHIMTPDTISCPNTTRHKPRQLLARTGDHCQLERRRMLISDGLIHKIVVLELRGGKCVTDAPILGVITIIITHYQCTGGTLLTSLPGDIT